MKHKIKLLTASLAFTIVGSLTQHTLSMDNGEKWNEQNQKRWPHLYAFELEDERAKDDSELKQIIRYECPEGKIIPFEQVQLSLAKLPYYTEGLFIELMFELYRLSTLENSQDELKSAQSACEQYLGAYREAYGKKFPNKDKNTFDTALQPFKDFCKETMAQGYSTNDEDQANDKFEAAWSLLDKAFEG